MFSSLRMGDAHLSLLDLYSLNLSSELVTLSGCSTGLNAVVGGDELLGLVRGLLCAGTRALLVTLWDVDDRTTEDFMRRFYGHLVTGSDKAKAIRQSMREVREQNPHPYYWAPFALIGS
jgi:CHAT domain-containing protein